MMKRLISILLICVLAIGLCACGDLSNIELPPLPTVTPEVVETTAEPTVEPTAEPAVEESSAGQVIVSVKNTTEQAYDPQDGSRLILSFSYDTPTVYIENNDDAADKINERLAIMNEAFYTGNDYGDGAVGFGYNDMLTIAEDNFNVVTENQIEGAMLEMSSSYTASVKRNDGKVLTVLYGNYTFTGGAHGSYCTRGYSFDVSTGELLTLDDLSSDADALKSALVEYMVNAVSNDGNLATQIDLIYDHHDMESVLEPLLRQGSWYFDENGMVIFSDLYEISSYAAGPVYFNIPYSEFENFIDIDSKWLPDEISDNGSISAVTEDNMTDGSVAIIDKLVVDAEGEQLYLVANGSVRDVEVCYGQFADSFYSTENLWYCSSLDSSALQLVASIPEGLPDLQISYYDAEGQHQLYLTHSGEDGSVILSDSVEAVG
jgi:predicted small lipoprotein YifL